ncbi:DUF4275 family protein [Lysinibacillus mangiferihumi]|uniref:DUF4275 family protein n=1 Tax=Lysinibacillus mangiferihumi TaxID=1130819 RepID=A0A4V5TIC3_9BACI|nr:DUF4275 family protein [Lysinibacillus mangiferihumi]TKI53323.1 DUF4275 family protein [Lysinibacillus mangiferihumi]
MIRDKINKILDILPEEELESVYWSIVPIQKSYEFKQHLSQKGVQISQLIYEENKIINLWDKTFAKNISENLKKEIHYEQFKWHIFSYEKQDCLKKDVAREAFDTISKDELYVMYQGCSFVFLYTNANEVVSKDFDSQQDIYIFDKNFTWTYVHTHESMCGPYFYKVL